MRTASRSDSAGKYIDNIAAHPVRALRQVELIALVLQLGEAPQDRALVDAIAAGHRCSTMLK